MAFSIHTAKLNRELLKDFARNNLNLSKTAITLIFHLTPYVDRDGRLNFNKETVRRNMHCDRRTFESALFELCNTEYNGKNLLTYENGYYVSNFHLSSNGKQSYLKHIPFYNSSRFLGLTKNQTRLFLYIATLNVKNQYVKIAVENLYKNLLHDNKYGMPVYDDYRSMAEDLFYLIDLGFVSVRLPNEDKEVDNSNADYKERFHALCGFRNQRKNRTSIYKKTKHSIGLRVNPELHNKEAIENQASKAEIRMLADQYHMFHEDMKVETINYIIGKKNTMVESFGVAGLNIYRSSLEKYFFEKNENIIYYDLLNKAANHFTDFYLLEEIKKVILGALKFELGDIEGIASTGYSFNQTNIPSLVEYFITNSSDEHKVIIDQDIQLIEEAHELMSGLGAEDPWIDLQESIDVVYKRHISEFSHMFLKECGRVGVDNPLALMEQINSKEMVISLAKKSLLSQKETSDREVKELKEKVRFFKQKQVFAIPDSELEVKDERIPPPDTYINYFED